MQTPPDVVPPDTVKQPVALEAALFLVSQHALAMLLAVQITIRCSWELPCTAQCLDRSPASIRVLSDFSFKVNQIENAGCPRIRSEKLYFQKKRLLKLSGHILDLLDFDKIFPVSFLSLFAE